jgi:hypothetical protein
MRDKWYGDNRDLVKWAVLVALARRYRVKHILQVLYFRPDMWAGVEIDGKSVEMNQAVIEQFRRAASISMMNCGARIEVVEDVFSDRTVYLQRVLDRIRHRPQAPGIVFLDPDTGLEPGKPNLKHVLDSELAEIWRSMIPDDLMVFYQHQTNRNGEEWIEPKKSQFERALNIRPGSAKLAHGVKIARDVAFFFAAKENSERKVESRVGRPALKAES